MGDTNKQIMITELPDGQLEERHFSQREASVPELGDLVRLGDRASSSAL